MKLLNLFWHNILPDSISPEMLDGAHPRASMFREQLRLVIDHYTPISVSDFVAIAENPDLLRLHTKPPVVLGFDDGFRNVITQAFPILNEFRVPAVFFVIGEVLHNPAFVPWFVEFTHLIRRTQKKKINYGDSSIDLSSRNDQVNLLHLFEASFKASRSEAERQRCLMGLADRLGVARPVASDLDDDLRFVTKEDLAALGPSSLLTIASHAMTHRHLDCLTDREQADELEQSDSLLCKFCPSYYPVISYPSGCFSAETIARAKQIYKAGFAVFLKSSCRNRYRYPRIGINHASVQELAYILNPIRLNYLLPLKRFLHVTGLRKV